MGTDTEVEALSESRIYELLSNERRRRVVKHLRTDGGRASLEELVSVLASEENGIPASELESEQRRRIRVSLTQSHLPKLADAGVISWDDEAKIVQRGERAPDLEAYVLTENGRARWPWYYVLLSGGAVALFGLSWVVPRPGWALSPVTIGALVVSGLVCLSVVHLLSVRRRAE